VKNLTAPRRHGDHGKVNNQHGGTNMTSQAEYAATFKSLHKKCDPVILFNIWDPGSAQAVADQGAHAVALGSHGVANALGYEDGEQIPLELLPKAQDVLLIACNYQ